MNRIETIAQLIKHSKTHVDIGCDHCYLCKYCLEHHLVKYFINIDINDLPLQNGKNNIEAKHLNQCLFIKNDGLKDLNLKFSSLSISGLGTKTIINILKDIHYKYKFGVIQANNNVWLIRKYLLSINAKIVNEKLVYENNIFYIIIKYKLKKTNIKTDVDIYIGPILKKQNHEHLYNYLKQKIDYYDNFINDKTDKNILKEYHVIKEFLNNYEN